MKNKQTVLDRIESARIQATSLKTQLEQKVITKKDAIAILDRIESVLDNIENLIDLEDENF